LCQRLRFLLTLLAIEVVAICPFIAKALEGRAVVFWAHYGIRPYFFGALALLSVGIILAFLLKNRSVALVVAAILSIPIFVLPFLEMGIITSMPGF
jgi:cellulose synthase/poly-beta-1,6-N-acetylglucosamine synthase-like glycosyltransferase